MIIPHLDIEFDLAKVRHQLAAHGQAGAIYYAKDSTFWSHHRGHALAQDPKTMKCPLGAQIFMERDWEGWLEGAVENPAFYGRHGLKAFVAGHYGNCKHPASGAGFSAKSWEPFNRALDAEAAVRG